MGTARKYMQAYDSFKRAELYCPEQLSDIENIGVHKLSYMNKLSDEQFTDIMKSKAATKINVDQFRQLTNKVKETGEYSEDLLNEIRQKDDKIKTKEAETIQLQQEKEQKDQEIAELKAKLQKIEEEKIQPVGNSEPEVVEKIVEVEKVVEKEVVPDYINQEIEQKEELIEKLTNQVEGLNDALSLFKNQEKLVKEEAFKDNDWDKLCSEIGNFVRKSAQYTFLETDYINLDSMYQKRVLNSLNKIENWLLKMKQITNQNLTIGNVIYSDVDFEESEE